MSKGYVYVLVNDHMPGLVKIGKTTRTVEGRASELYQAGVPSPFRVFYFGCAPDCHQVEGWVHSGLADKRVNESREFFAIDPELAKGMIEAAIHEQVSVWMEEFVPGQVMVDDFAYVDPSVFLIIADALDVFPADVAMAINTMTADELRPAMDRHIAKYHQNARLRVVAE